jgi:hypothetical protein
MVAHDDSDETLATVIVYDKLNRLLPPIFLFTATVQ